MFRLLAKALLHGLGSGRYVAWVGQHGLGQLAELFGLFAEEVQGGEKACDGGDVKGVAAGSKVWAWQLAWKSRKASLLVRTRASAWMTTHECMISGPVIRAVSACVAKGGVRSFPTAQPPSQRNRDMVKAVKPGVAVARLECPTPRAQAST